MLSCAALLVSCQREAEPSDAADNAVVQERPSLPVAEPPLDRERLLLAAARAASAFAAGAEILAAQRGLNGKRFEIRFRIGCNNTDTQDEMRGWRFDEKLRTLRMRVEPDLSINDPIVAGIAAGRFESVEGLWVRRPWMLTAACPKIRSSAPAPAKAADEAGSEAGGEATRPPISVSPAIALGRQVGIAQFFSATDSRTSRRSQRPYATTNVLDEGQKPSLQGYDFVMAGRLRELPDRRVIACSSDTTDAPPADSPR